MASDRAMLAIFPVGVAEQTCISEPPGGGQPADRGTLIPIDDEDSAAAVTDVQRDGSGAIVHTVTTPLPVGASVKVVLDWGRRFDHMQHHTVRNSAQLPDSVSL